MLGGGFEGAKIDFYIVLAKNYTLGGAQKITMRPVCRYLSVTCTKSAQ